MTTFSIPEVGNQSSQTEKTRISISPTQNSGVAYAMMAPSEMRWSLQVRTQMAAKSPDRTPTPTDSTSVVPIRSRVGTIRSSRRSETLELWRNEKPRSKKTTFLT